MGSFFIDDSVHFKEGFIIAACVYTQVDTIEDKINEVIISNGFDPTVFEYKSSANYSKEPEKSKVREALKVLLADSCRMGILIVPSSERSVLGFECVKAIKQFTKTNKDIDKHNMVFVDQGMFTNKQLGIDFVKAAEIMNCTFHIEQDSKVIKGIQLADLAAHVASIQLKDAMGLVTKMVKVGESSGYDPDTEIELGFEMFATIRYLFFNKGVAQASDDPIAMATVDVEPYGLYVSSLCSKDLAEIARSRFGKVYLGCIH